MTIYTFQIFYYGDGASAPIGGSRMVDPDAQAITFSVSDNDATLHDNSTSSGGVIDPDGLYTQTLSSPRVLNGVTYPAGRAVASAASYSITNSTTGQSGTAYSIYVTNSSGSYVIAGYAYSIPVEAGDTLAFHSLNSAGQTSYSTFAPLTSGPLPDGYVDGTAGNDLIGSSYTDAQGEKIDNNDQTLAGASANDDYVLAGDGNDTVMAGAGNDIVYGGSGNDSLNGDIGNDTIYGDSGDDTLQGAAGADQLWGGDGFDLASYAASTAGVNVSLEYGTASGGHADGDTLYGIEGLIGSGFDDTLAGNYFDNALYGGSGNDLLSGGYGNDTISGGTGDDRIIGGEGNDLLTGGSGNDIFELIDGETTLSGQDTITDFDMTLISGRTADQFDVSDLLDQNGNPVRVSDVVVSDDGFGNARLTFPSGESVVLSGVSPASVNSYAVLNSMGIPRFAAGTMIKVPGGEALVETLRPGDRVETIDHGAQPLKWVGYKAVTRRELDGAAAMRPVQIKAGTLGATSDLWVSQQHRMLVTLRGEAVLVRALHLAKMALPGVRVARGKRNVCYHHLLFAQHEVIFANGAATESFYPGRIGLRSLSPLARLEILCRLPEMGGSILTGASPLEYFGPTARRVVTCRDMDKLEPGTASPLAWLEPSSPRSGSGY